MLNTILEQIWEKKLVFLGTFFLVFTLSYVVLLAVDYLPEQPATDAAEEIKAENDDEVIEINKGETPDSLDEVQAEVSGPQKSAIKTETQMNDSFVTVSSNSVLPLQIYIERLDKTVSVSNPNSRTIADLDAALLNGVVRHPDSATLGQDGNVFILGHSSYLPTVFNKNFQAFNGIQNLKWGDTIEVSSNENTVYRYRVEKVYRASAQDVTVPIAGEEKKLTLATCNSFGSVDDRYIVEASQIE